MRAWVIHMELARRRRTRLVRGVDRPLSTKGSTITLKDAQRTGNNEKPHEGHGLPTSWDQASRERPVRGVDCPRSNKISTTQVMNAQRTGSNEIKTG